MKKNIFNDNKIIGLSPMAGYTDTAFRKLCKDYGADLVYTELISAKGLVYDWRDHGISERMPSWELATFNTIEQPILVQLFGDEPEIMAEAAGLVMRELKPYGIDLNMGCPAPKVVKNNCGSYLLKEPDVAYDIVKAVRKSIGDGFLSVKTRLGWDDRNEVYEFAKNLEAAGVDMIALHCRTKEEKFASVPAWEAVARVKEIVKVPVLANGGIANWQDAEKCLEISRADGILIGQAAIGKPWIFEEIKNKSTVIKMPQEIAKIAKEHLELAASNKLRFLDIKKHLNEYFKGFEKAGEFRVELMGCSDYECAFNKINSLL